MIAPKPRHLTAVTEIANVRAPALAIDADVVIVAVTVDLGMPMATKT